MRTLCCFISLLAGVPFQDDGGVKELIRQLSDESIDVRQKAQQKLEAMGPAHAPALKAAMAEATDGELQARLMGILNQFTRKVIVEGSHPSLAPDGTLVVFRKLVEDPEQQTMRGDPVYRSDVWIFDPATGKERLLAKDDANLGWAGKGRVMLRDGGLVDAGTGKTVEGAAALPPKLEVMNVRWNPAGDHLVYIPDSGFYASNSNLEPPASVEKTLHLVDAGGKVRKLELNHAINCDSRGFLSWSPDGKRLAINLLFFRKGDLPIRRIGVVDIAAGSVTYVADGAYVHGNPGLHSSEFGSSAPEAWDAKGERFAFVTGHGHGEGDVYIAKADGTGMTRLTDDPLCKWEPAIDPAGRRIAYRAARLAGDEGHVEDECIKVLDIFTGEEETLRFEEEETGFGMTWSPDGTRLIYGMGGKVLEARFVPAAAVAADAKPFQRGPGTRKAEVLAALASGKSSRIEWGAALAAELRKDAEVTAALRKALKESVAMIHPGGDLLSVLVALDAREAAPEILEACAAGGAIRAQAIRVAARWNITGAGACFEKIRKEETGKARAWAAGGLVRLGTADAWADLKTLAASDDSEVRLQVVRMVEDHRDPKSVDLLIGLVGDKTKLYLDIAYENGIVQVGDEVEDGLAGLTGRTFGRDGAKWKAWWDGCKRELPEVVLPNKAIQQLDREREKRRADFIRDKAGR